MFNVALSMALMKEDPEDSINSLLSSAGEKMESERAYIFEFTRSNQLNNTYEWCAPGVAPVIGMLQDVSLEVYAPCWLPRFLRHEYIMIPDMEAYAAIDLPMYRLLKAQDIHTLLAAPIYLEGKFIGFVGVDNPPAKFMQYVAPLFQALTSIVGVLLRHRDNRKKLQQLAFHDRLTGVGNRYACDDCMKRLDREKPIGLVFGDLNGLKQMNDTRGHEEGDLLIYHAAQVMQEQAGARGRVFRMGGDEFLIVYAGIGRQDFAQEVARLRQNLSRQNVSMVVGAVWHENVRQNADALITEADLAMYKKKDAYHHRRRCRIYSLVGEGAKPAGQGEAASEKETSKKA